MVRQLMANQFGVRYVGQLLLNEGRMTTGMTVNGRSVTVKVGQLYY